MSTTVDKPQHKTCPGCLRVLPLTDFSPDSTRHNGRRSACRDCVASRWRARHPGSLPRGRYKEQAATFEPLPAQTCRCIGGPSPIKDEDEIRCWRCGKQIEKPRNERSASPANSAFLARGENDSVQPRPTHKTGAAPPQTTRPAATRSAILVTTQHLTHSSSLVAKGGR